MDSQQLLVIPNPVRDPERPTNRWLLVDALGGETSGIDPPFETMATVGFAASR